MNTQRDPRPWYRTTGGVIAIVLGASFAAKLITSDKPAHPVAAEVSASAPAAAAPAVAAAFPGRALSASEMEPAITAFLDHRYSDDQSFSTKAVRIAEPKPSVLVVEVEVRGKQRLTVGLMRDAAVREAMELIRSLSSSRAFDAVHLYQVSVYLPATDRYAQPIEVEGLSVTMKADEAGRVNWGAMSQDRFLALARDVGAVRLHPSLQQ